MKPIDPERVGNFNSPLNTNQKKSTDFQDSHLKKEKHSIYKRKPRHLFNPQTALPGSFENSHRPLFG